MTSSTWSFDAPGRLVGCGIDAERPVRFVELAEEEHPLPLVFTSSESEHARSTRDPPRSLAAAFCCKEALRKALGIPYDWRDCELFWRPGERRLPIRLAPSLIDEHALSDAVAFISASPDDGEVVVVSYLFASGGPRVSTTLVEF